MKQPGTFCSHLPSVQWDSIDGVCVVEERGESNGSISGSRVNGKRDLDDLHGIQAAGHPPPRVTDQMRKGARSMGH
jgi:hypothetical protein